MSSSAKKRFPVRCPVQALDLGCSCRQRKLSYLFSFPPLKPKPQPHSNPKQRHHHPFWSYYPFSPSTATTAATSPFDTSHQPSSTSATTPSPYDEDASSPILDATWATKGKRPGAAKMKPTSGPRGKGGRVAESVAVVKESHDPYHDFRDSMLQMIMEKEIYAWDDLRELLHRFLALNSPCHHDAILRAFSEIYNGVFSAAADIAATA